MAGSYSHLVAEDGSFRFDLIDNMGDAHEACEDSFNKIADLKAELESLKESINAKYWNGVRDDNSRLADELTKAQEKNLKLLESFRQGGIKFASAEVSRLKADLDAELALRERWESDYHKKDVHHQACITQRDEATARADGLAKACLKAAEAVDRIIEENGYGLAEEVVDGGSPEEGVPPMTRPKCEWCNEDAEECTCTGKELRPIPELLRDAVKGDK